MGNKQTVLTDDILQNYAVSIFNPYIHFNREYRNPNE